MFRKSNLIFNLLIVGALLLLFAGGAMAKAPDYVQGSKFAKPAGSPSQTLSNISNWAYWLYWDGKSANDPLGNSGGIYPRGTAGVIFQDGFIWGGYLEGDSLPRVGGQTYNIGTVPGWINPDGMGADPNAPDVRIYRIRKDYKTLTFAQVKQDAAEQLMKPANTVTEEEAQNIIDQYAKDWEEWPVDKGAPYIDKNGNGIYDKDEDEPGIANADQVVWFAANDLDASATTALYGSQPIGIELQVTAWAYNQPGGTIGQLIFKRYKLINKSGKRIDSMFVAQWCDPDVGNYSDDYVGCDSILSIGFAYNAYQTDDEFSAFGLAPAAIGYDFFQGPRVYTGNPADTAIFDLKYWPGYKNLPMTSFGYFAAGSAIPDPTLGKYEGTKQWYNLLNGYIPTDDLKDPSPFVHGSGPLAGKPTKFPVNGDPVNGTGDIDGLGSNLPPGDRRMVLASGPFTMQPGDTQEVVVAIIGGLGDDNLGSVSKLKQYDEIAQALYDDLFTTVPKPPAAPHVVTMVSENEIVLNWGTDSSKVAETEKYDEVTGYDFEGYNVYQLPSASSTIDQAKRLATFDKINGVTTIEGYRFLPEYGQKVLVPVQFGTDNGIQHYFIIEKDYINDKPLYQGNSYYFAVTAYNYNPDPQLIEDKTLESPLQIIEVIPQPERPGYKYEGTVGQDLEVIHDPNISDGIVKAVVVDPSRTTGHEYQVFFTMDEDTNSSTYGEIVWNLRDVTTGEVKLKKQKVSESIDDKNGELIVDGILVKVSGPAPGVKAIVEVANANGPLPPEDWDTAGEPYHGNNVWHSLSAPSDPNRFYLSAGGGEGNIERHLRSIANAEGHDYEMRFTQDGGIYLWWYDDDTWANVPFEWWDVGMSTFDDTTDDIRGLTGGYSGGTATGPDGFTFDYTDPAFGFPATDWVYLRIPLDDQGTYDVFYNDVTSGALTYGWWDHSKEVLARLIICDYGGAGTLPETGTVIRWITTKPITLDDIFTFTAPKVLESKDLARAAVEKINVFPNPYYAFNPQATNRFDRFVTFNHLPKKATIRIFDLGGTQVRKLEKNDDSQFLKWDLKNESGLPVASGIYIAHIDMPDLGKTKVLKVFIIQADQIIQYY